MSAYLALLILGSMPCLDIWLFNPIGSGLREQPIATQSPDKVSATGQRGDEARRLPDLGCLLEGEGQLEQHAFAEAASHKGDVDRQPMRITRWDRHERVADPCCRPRSPQPAGVTADQVDRPRRVDGRR